MKVTVLMTIPLLLLTLSFLNSGDNCSFAQAASDFPERLVIVKGKAVIINHPDLGVTPANSEVVIFQKVGCNSCYVRANVDFDGNYKISVGDGKYKIIVRNPSSPEFDMLAPGQERFIDTDTDEAKKHSKQVFDFDIKIKLPK